MTMMLFRDLWKFDPQQPCEPAGSETGGQWSRAGGAPSSRALPQADRDAIRRQSLARRMEQAIKTSGGFTIDDRTTQDVTDGYAVGAFPAHSAVLDATTVTSQQIAEWMTKQQSLLRDPRIVVGGWHDKESGKVGLDLVRVYRPDQRDLALAVGRKRNQISIANLRAIAQGDWEHAILDTGGTGAAKRSGLRPMWVLVDLDSDPAILYAALGIQKYSPGQPRDDQGQWTESGNTYNDASEADPAWRAQVTQWREKLRTTFQPEDKHLTDGWAVFVLEDGTLATAKNHGDMAEIVGFPNLGDWDSTINDFGRALDLVRVRPTVDFKTKQITMVHVNVFGETISPRAEAAVRRYIREVGDAKLRVQIERTLWDAEEYDWSSVASGIGTLRDFQRMLTQAGIKARTTKTLGKYDPQQPRDPAGSSTGGQWSAGGGTATDTRTAEERETARINDLVNNATTTTELDEAHDLAWARLTARHGTTEHYQHTAWVGRNGEQLRRPGPVYGEPERLGAEMSYQHHRDLAMAVDLEPGLITETGAIRVLFAASGDRDINFQWDREPTAAQRLTLLRMLRDANDDNVGRFNISANDRAEGRRYDGIQVPRTVPNWSVLVSRWFGERYPRLAVKLFNDAFDKYDPNQPRVPAGDPQGGQWTAGVAGAYNRLGSQSTPMGRARLFNDTFNDSLGAPRVGGRRERSATPITHDEAWRQETERFLAERAARLEAERAARPVETKPATRGWQAPPPVDEHGQHMFWSYTPTARDEAIRINREIDALEERRLKPQGTYARVNDWTREEDPDVVRQIDELRGKLPTPEASPQRSAIEREDRPSADDESDFGTADDAGTPDDYKSVTLDEDEDGEATSEWTADEVHQFISEGMTPRMIVSDSVDVSNGLDEEPIFILPNGKVLHGGRRYNEHNDMIDAAEYDSGMVVPVTIWGQESTYGQIETLLDAGIMRARMVQHQGRNEMFLSINPKTSGTRAQMKLLDRWMGQGTEMTIEAGAGAPAAGRERDEFTGSVRLSDPSSFTASEMWDLITQAMNRQRHIDKFDPQQPRVPAGNPQGGQWTSGAGGVVPDNVKEFTVGHMSTTSPLEVERFKVLGVMHRGPGPKYHTARVVTIPSDRAAHLLDPEGHPNDGQLFVAHGVGPLAEFDAAIGRQVVEWGRFDSVGRSLVVTQLAPSGIFIPKVLERLTHWEPHEPNQLTEIRGLTPDQITFTHNHPSGTGPSPEDLIFGLQAGVGRIRVIANADVPNVYEVDLSPTWKYVNYQERIDSLIGSIRAAWAKMTSADPEDLMYYQQWKESKDNRARQMDVFRRHVDLVWRRWSKLTKISILKNGKPL